MKVIAEQILADAVRRYGREIALDERRCEAVLKDLFGGDACRREVHLLMCAVWGGAVAQLLAGGNGVPKAVLEARLIKRLCDQYGVTDELAGWSVKSWMMALGMMAPNDDPKPQNCATPVMCRKSGDVDVVDFCGGENLELVRCPSGSFMMGSSASEANRSDNEIQHRVTLRKSFWMGKYEVTQGQWERVMGSNPANFKGARNPVERVSWEDCQEFIRKLNALDGGRASSRAGLFRLPTEAEWEYACRAGTATAFHYGNDLDASMANFDGNYPYGNGQKEQYRQTTTPVGSFKPNAWGLYDMHGNVWEWCRDWHGDYPAGSVTDPAGPGSGWSRVRRGGSWINDAGDCRSADRGGLGSGSRIGNLGLRLVRILS